ncbi:hypothetical protein VTK73DRAFT_2494 [Phialemonium thermophilum]|uniref:Transcription elongation factor Eaf N-terminal domain-containing protein n=1 Tax=Phialemonium thermophilum TaxID=223376 RepID=A0ABR3Y1C0_9PEZI
MSAAQGIIDPTKPGKYPVILSDALLGKPSSETYTGIRYNHKPALSSESAPFTARLRKSAKDGSYNLGFDDKGNKYTYNGTRTSNDGQYVLIFDPARKALVLHRLDSLFHMNITRTPDNANAESLRIEFPQLQVSGPIVGSGSASGSSSSSQAASDQHASRTSATSGMPDKGKAAASAPPKPTKEKAPVSLTLPDSAKAAPPMTTESTSKAKQRRREELQDEDEEEDDDDDDGGLTIEYPGGAPPSTDFSPAFPSFPAQINRRFSDFVRDAGEDDEEEDEDADAEFEDVGMEGGDEEDEEVDEEASNLIDAFKLPSPVEGRGNDAHMHQYQQQIASSVQPQAQDQQPEPYGSVDNMDDMDADLEADLEREFQKVSGALDMDSESSVSEED